MPEGLEKIPERCFAESGVEMVKIPKSVAVIQKEAFKKCRKLKKITFANDSALVELGDSAFLSCISLKTISLPLSLEIIRE